MRQIECRFACSLCLTDTNRTKNIESLGDSKVTQSLKEKDDFFSMVASMRGSNNDNTINPTGGSSTRSHDIASFDWQVKLDQEERYHLDWSVNYTGNEVLFGLKIDRTKSNFHQGSDVFAIGFSSNYGNLNSSDFCLIWHDLSHRTHMQDARTSSNNQLFLIDESRSFCKLLKRSKRSRTDRKHMVHSSSQPEVIEYSFSRPLDTCLDDYYIIDNGTTHLVWFTIKGPLLSLDGLNLDELRAKHWRSGDMFESGLVRVQLIATKAEVAPDTKMSKVHDIRMDKYKIPSKETTYWCKLFKLPKKFEKRKLHITKYEAVIDESSKHLVHHMELFNCVYMNEEQKSKLKDLYESKGGWSGECDSKDRPRVSEICRKVILAWAMGAKPLEYPKEVGQSIGGKDYSPYVVLEVHYNNVELKADLVDNSGLRFHYTNKLRLYDAGILEVGLEYTDKNSIPPNVITPLAGYCVSECTRIGLVSTKSSSKARRMTDTIDYASEDNNDNKPGQLKDFQEVETEAEAEAETEPESVASSSGRNSASDGGIFIFAGQLHTHLAGVASWTEHIRAGRLIGELQRDDHYSPHSQEIRLLPKPVHLAPGDALIHYCLYDTRRRSNITLGGFATSDEMCVTYLHYYPRMDLEVCKSSIDSPALSNYFAYLAKEEKQPTGDKLMKTISENYKSIEWSNRRSEELLNSYLEAPLSVQCNRSDGNRFAGYWDGVTPTRVYYWPDESGHQGKGEGQETETGLLASDQLIYSKDYLPAGPKLARGHSEASNWIRHENRAGSIMDYRGYMKQQRERLRNLECASSLTRTRARESELTLEAGNSE